METGVALRFQHIESPSFSGHYRFFAHQGSAFLTVRQCDFLARVAYAESRVVIIAVREEFVCGYMVDVVHSTAGSVGSQVRLYGFQLRIFVRGCPQRHGRRCGAAKSYGRQ